MENFVVTIEPVGFSIKKILRIEEEAEKMNGGSITIAHGTKNAFYFNSPEAKNRFERWMEAYMNEQHENCPSTCWGGSFVKKRKIKENDFSCNLINKVVK